MCVFIVFFLLICYVIKPTIIASVLNIYRHFLSLFLIQYSITNSSHGIYTVLGIVRDLEII